MKTCTKCGEEKALGEFRKNATSSGGRRSDCRSCISILQRKRYERDRETILEKQHDYNRRNREAQAEKSRRWRDRYPEAVRQQQRDYYGRNREQVVKSRRDYYERNRDPILTRGRNLNAATRLDATYSRQPWTPAEDSVIARDDLTHIEKAFMLKRTLQSVSTRRRTLRKLGVLT